MPGEALGPVLDSFEFATVGIELPYITHLDGEYYAVSYTEYHASLWLKTYRITSAGVISEIDTWELSAEDCRAPSLYHIGGDLYAMTYKWFDGADNLGRIKTLHISNTGVITKSFDDTYNIAEQKYKGNLVRLPGGFYAFISNRVSTHNMVKTFSIVSGANGITLHDEFDYTERGFQSTNIGAVGSNIVFCCHPYYAVYGVHTFQVTVPGIISDGEKDDQDFPGVGGWDDFGVVKVNSNIFGIACGGYGAEVVKAQTFRINNDGTIQPDLIGDVTFGATDGQSTDFTESGTEGLYFVTYRNADGDGMIDVVEINASGVITDPAAYSPYKFNDGESWWPRQLPAIGNVIPVVYANVSKHGWLKSIYFGPPPVGVHHEMIMKIGP